VPGNIFLARWLGEVSGGIVIGVGAPDYWLSRLPAQFIHARSPGALARGRVEGARFRIHRSSR
jgi:hypothetical protein